MQTAKSKFSFTLKDCEPLPKSTKKLPFHDPTALPLLETIIKELKQRGYDVDQPRVAKTGYVFYVNLQDVSITIDLLATRENTDVAFNLLTWPTQPLSEEFLKRPRSESFPDCHEWETVCKSISEILVKQIKPESLLWTKFKNEH